MWFILFRNNCVSSLDELDLNDTSYLLDDNQSKVREATAIIVIGATFQSRIFVVEVHGCRDLRCVARVWRSNRRARYQAFRMRLTENQAVPALGYRLRIGPVRPLFSSNILCLQISCQMTPGIHLLLLRQLLKEVCIVSRLVRRPNYRRILAA